MGMLNNKNKHIESGANDVTSKQRATRNEILNQSKSNQTQDNPPSNNKRVTTSTTIRVTNHICNQVEALVKMGLAHNNHDFVSDAVHKIVDKWKINDQPKYNQFKQYVEKLERLDYVKSKFKL